MPFTYSKRFIFLSVFLLALFGWVFSAKAMQVGLDSVAYWDLQVKVGSGTAIEDGVVEEDGDTYLPPSFPPTNPPAGILLPDLTFYEVFSDLNNDYNDDISAYAEYDATATYLEAYAKGWAEDVTSDTDWFYALSKVALMSEPFTGFPSFNISFDWTFSVDFGGGDGDAKIGFGLVDYTDPTNPIPVYWTFWVYDPLGATSGTYTWSINTLDPTHTYVYGIGARAFVEGADGVDDAYVSTGINNVKAYATPEPASALLVGGGLVLVGFLVRRRDRNI